MKRAHNLRHKIIPECDLLIAVHKLCDDLFRFFSTGLEGKITDFFLCLKHVLPRDWHMAAHGWWCMVFRTTGILVL